MAASYDRLPLQDSSFLVFETPNTHMHLGGVAIFERGSLGTPEGGIDSARIRAHLGARLDLIPRYRQRLAFVPLERQPVWVDDEHFNLGYHVRHTSLPRPGTDRQLKRLAGRIMSQALDRGKPLWEAWVVEGLEFDRFALIIKTHHCMSDGVSAVGLLTVLLTTEGRDGEAARTPWTPRPAPTPGQLLRDEAARVARMPLALLRGTLAAVQEPAGASERLLENLSAMWQTVTAGLRGAAETPFNRPVGPHRRFDWLTLDLAEVKAVKNRLGGTVNDVVLTTVAGAVARLLRRHGVSAKALDYRAVVPVSVREVADEDTVSNRASAWITSLPVQERDPRRRLAKVRALTAQLKASKQALGPWALLRVAEWVGPVLLTLGIRLTNWLHPYNLIVTNIAGPQLPLYMLGARMLAGYPLVPLFENQGIGVAIFSYDGKLFFGINTDRDTVPDPYRFVEDISAAFEELRTAPAGTRAVGTDDRSRDAASG